MSDYFPVDPDDTSAGKVFVEYNGNKRKKYSNQISVWSTMQSQSATLTFMGKASAKSGLQ